MKSLILMLSLTLCIPSFAAEVLTCKLSPQQTVKITKDQANYFFSTNSGRFARLASAQTVPAQGLRNESSLLDLLKYMRIPVQEVARANVYQLTQNADGGRTIIRFIFKNDTYLAVHVSMGRVVPCL